MSISWKCLSLFVYMRWRRCCLVDRLGFDIGIYNWWPAVVRGISPNVALLFGGPNSLPFFLARQTLPGLNVVIYPCTAILVFVVTALLCVGIKESTTAQAIATTLNVCALIFVITVGGWNFWSLDSFLMGSMECLLGQQQFFLHISVLIQLPIPHRRLKIHKEIYPGG